MQRLGQVALARPDTEDGFWGEVGRRRVRIVNQASHSGWLALDLGRLGRVYRASWKDSCLNRKLRGMVGRIECYSVGSDGSQVVTAKHSM